MLAQPAIIGARLAMASKPTLPETAMKTMLAASAKLLEQVMTMGTRLVASE
jgi:hypothetical protein